MTMIIDPLVLATDGAIVPNTEEGRTGQLFALATETFYVSDSRRISDGGRPHGAVIQFLESAPKRNAHFEMMLAVFAIEEIEE